MELGPVALVRFRRRVAGFDQRLVVRFPLCIVVSAANEIIVANSISQL